ncbi:MAG: hypothetical protein P1U32_09145 [Legionellaceae bacterium]|nr:hypothetical protein [Legionellaceae bacterium]
MTFDDSFFGSLNFWNSLNFFRKAGQYVYNEEAMNDLSPRVREELLQKYYGGLGLSNKNAFNPHVEEYFKAQEKAFSDIVDKHGKNLTQDQKKDLKKQLKAMQEPIQKSALAYDKSVPGKTPTAVHPGNFVQHAQSEKAKLLKQTDDFTLPLLKKIATLSHKDPARETEIVKKLVPKRVKKTKPSKKPDIPIIPDALILERPDKKEDQSHPPPPPPPPPPSLLAGRDLNFFLDASTNMIEVANRIEIVERILNLEATLQEKKALPAPHDPSTAGEINSLQLQLEQALADYKANLGQFFNKRDREQRLQDLSKSHNIKITDYNNPPEVLRTTLEKEINALMDQKLASEKEKVHTKKNRPGRVPKKALTRAERNKIGEDELASIRKKRDENEAYRKKLKQFNIEQREQREKIKKTAAAAAAKKAPPPPPPKKSSTTPDDEGEEAVKTTHEDDEDEYETTYEEEDVEVYKDTKEPVNASSAPNGPDAIDVDALAKELQSAQKDARKKFEDDLNNTVNALQVAAQRERDLIGWLAASECAQRRLQQQTFFSKPTSDYTSLMTGDVQLKVKQLHTAIQEKSVEKIEQAGGIRTPSGQGIQVGKSENGQLTFSIKFPGLLTNRGYYTNARHNTKADLLFQAALVRGTGAPTIITDISHTNLAMRQQLIQEAYDAAIEIGYKPDEITITANGSKVDPKDIHKRVVESPFTHQKSEESTVDVSKELSNLTQNIQQQLGPKTPEANKAMQDQMKKVLDEERMSQGLPPEPPTSGPAIAA